MGCDFFYSGSLPDIKAQEQVVSLATSFYDSIALKVFPDPATRYLTRFMPLRVDRVSEDYPFDFFGIAPFFKDSICEQGQFIFDRTDNGRLVRFLKVPDHYNLPPWDKGYWGDDEQLIVNSGGHVRNGGSLGFALLLEIIRLRVWPDLSAGDDYNICDEVRGILYDAGLVEDMKDTTFDFGKCWVLFEAEYDLKHPPRPEYTPDPKPSLRIVPCNILKKPVQELEWSVRTSHILENGNIQTVEELLTYSPAELLSIEHCGRKSVREIAELLEWYGLYLQPDDNT